MQWLRAISGILGTGIIRHPHDQIWIHFESRRSGFLQPNVDELHRSIDNVLAFLVVQHVKSMECADDIIDLDGRSLAEIVKRYGFVYIHDELQQDTGPVLSIGY